MPEASSAPAAAEAAATANERPWLFAFLIAADAAISLGLLGGGLSYLLRTQGIDPGRSAGIISLLSLPHSIYFLWGPITDFWLRRRTWLVLAAVAAAATFAVAFMEPRLASHRAVALMFAGACFGVVVPAACGGMMGTLKDEANRRRAGAAYQIGSLAIGAIVVFTVVSLSAHTSIAAIGLVVAAMIVAPSLFAFAAPPQELIREPGAIEVRPIRFVPKILVRWFRLLQRALAPVWSEFKTTFLRWEAIPYTLLITAPFCSGALIGLLPGLAVDYGVTGAQVAWINGVGGALLTAAGAYCASLIPVRVRASIAFPVAGLVNSATAAVLAFGAQRPAVYFTGTVLFLFTIGAGYALFTGVVLEFLGGSGKSGSTRYSIMNSLGNLPVPYMTFLDGRAYAHWGPRGMPAAETILGASGATVLLVFSIYAARRRQSSARA
jgi:MFS transporter, PAT family, beta-lactamase induction signal transducer AmpG